MNRVVTVLGIVIIFCVAGCKDKTSPIPAQSFRVTTNNLIEGSDFLIKQVLIESHNDSTVNIREKGGGFDLTGTVKPMKNANTDLVFAELTFVAAIVKTPESGNIVKWLIKVNGQGIRAIGSSPYIPIEAQGQVEAASLNDVLQVKLDQEYYKRGYDIEIGNLQGKPLILSVR
jgi:hypothetical protein